MGMTHQEMQSAKVTALRAEIARRIREGEISNLTARQVAYFDRQACLEVLGADEEPQTHEPPQPEVGGFMPPPHPAPAEKAAETGRKATAGAPKGNGSGDHLADILAEALKDKIQATVDPADIQATVEKSIRETTEHLLAKFDHEVARIKKALDRPREIEVRHAETGKTKTIKRTHKIFEAVLRKAMRRRNVLLVGGAGSGKSYLASQIADALDLPYSYIAVGLQTSKADLMGYTDARGNYVRTLFREAYENGGLFLVDEIDAGNPNVLTTLNNATSNHQASFPDGMVQRHPDFILMAAGNTYGFGGNMDYVGRQRMDGATKDRFAVVTMDYDEDLERELGPDPKWTEHVIKLRHAAADLQEKILITPRASINGGGDIADGDNWDDVEEEYIWQGIDPAVRDRVKNHANGS